ncbi:hypothetical protein BKA64DRAFT_750455 [Cadophora sp. MPI-SDFR-AT-0126]|nr:hypothetical protein BKA64DRAFT_750455 [Leotiomycetes sp. MPI-SDFR-AT-0126]
MSTNRFNNLPNGFTAENNGFPALPVNANAGIIISNGNSQIVPPTRPSSPASDTTPRVLLHPRIAEAPSRHELISSVPTAQPPFFGGIVAYTHAPLLPRGSLQASTLNGVSIGNGHTTNGLSSSTPVARSSRYLTVPGQNDSIASTLEGLQISSCSDDMLIPTPHNTPAATPRTSPTALGRESSRRVAGNTPITPPPPVGYLCSNSNYTDSLYPGRTYIDRTLTSQSPRSQSSGTATESGLQEPYNTPVTPSVSPQRSPASSDGRVDTPRLARRCEPAVFGSSLHPTRRRGSGPKKKQKGKATKGKPTNGKLTNSKAKGKGSAKDKMLDDSALAVAHGESPIYTENIAAILQHPEAISVLSSAPEVDPTAINELLTSTRFRDVLAAFVETGRAGQNDPDFLEEALAASARRSAGDFDAVLDDKFEEIWAEEGGEEYSDEEGA